MTASSAHTPLPTLHCFSWLSLCVLARTIRYEGAGSSSSLIPAAPNPCSASVWGNRSATPPCSHQTPHGARYHPSIEHPAAEAAITGRRGCIIQISWAEGAFNQAEGVTQHRTGLSQTSRRISRRWWQSRPVRGLDTWIQDLMSAQLSIGVSIDAPSRGVFSANGQSRRLIYPDVQRHHGKPLGGRSLPRVHIATSSGPLPPVTLAVGLDTMLLWLRHGPGRHLGQRVNGRETGPVRTLSAEQHPIPSELTRAVGTRSDDEPLLKQPCAP